MSKFLKTLLEATESELNSRREKERNTVFKSLLPIIKELESLQALGVKFQDGTLFQYSVFTDGDQKGNIEILTPEPCFIIAHETSITRKSSFAFRFSQDEPLPGKLHGPEYVGYEYFFIEPLLEDLAKYIGKFIGSLGLADKSIYSKNVQDTIGIG